MVLPNFSIEIIDESLLNVFTYNELSSEKLYIIPKFDGKINEKLIDRKLELVNSELVKVGSYLFVNRHLEKFDHHTNIKFAKHCELCHLHDLHIVFFQDYPRPLDRTDVRIFASQFKITLIDRLGIAKSIDSIHC